MVVITLLSDFGVKDPYVGQMKGVILSVCPNATIVDISHDIGRHNLTMGSFMLETTVPFFPLDTIHVAVVDPGVGTSRLPLVIVCNRAVLIGPDNGLLIRASEILKFKSAYQIREKQFMAQRVSSTFHGRDMFAATAGKIAAGHKPEEVGPKASRLVKLNVPGIHLSSDGAMCSVLHVDVFGNVITNLAEKEAVQFKPRKSELVKIRTAGREYPARFVKLYSDVVRGNLAVLWGSQGYLEIAVREGNAAMRLGVKPLDRLELHVS